MLLGISRDLELADGAAEGFQGAGALIILFGSENVRRFDHGQAASTMHEWTPSLFKRSEGFFRRNGGKNFD